MKRGFSKYDATYLGIANLEAEICTDILCVKSDTLSRYYWRSVFYRTASSLSVVGVCISIMRVCPAASSGNMG